MTTNDIDNFADKVVEVIKDWFKGSGFKDRKLTDTPTDNLQVVNKKYCDANSGGGGVAGNDKDIQFNDGGVMGGDDAFKWNKATGNLELGNADTSNPAYITSPTGVEQFIYTGDGIRGGQLRLKPGNGGDALLMAGDGLDTDNGGSLSLTAGDGGSTSGDGGSVNITAGNSVSASGVGGQLNISAGSGVGAFSGDIYLSPGTIEGTSPQEWGNTYLGGVNGLPTGANNGFGIIGNCFGQPTGIPPQTGALIYDNQNNKLWIYNGGWKYAQFS